MKHIFIVNPIAGQTDAVHSLVPKIIEAVADTGVEYEVEITRYPKHSLEIARDYIEKAKNKSLRLYAVGGDGTLKELFTAAAGHKNVEVASIPCGSGNDFVRNFGSKESFLDIQKVIEGESIAVDLVHVNDDICAAITSVGLDAEVAYNIPSYRRIPFLSGSMAYNISIVQRLLSKIGRKMRITIDGKKTEGDFLIGTVCNGRAYGGGYSAAPFAMLDDGILELVFVKKVGRLKIASIIGKYKNGEHFGKDGKIVPELRDIFKHYSGREISIEPLDGKPFILNMDGECMKAPYLKAKVLPGAAKFVLPKELYEKYVKEKQENPY